MNRHKEWFCVFLAKGREGVLEGSRARLSVEAYWEPVQSAGIREESLQIRVPQPPHHQIRCSARVPFSFSSVFQEDPLRERAEEKMVLGFMYLGLFHFIC